MSTLTMSLHTMSDLQTNAAVIALSTLTLVVLYTGLSLLVNYRKCPQIKGPWLACVSELWLFRSTTAGRMYEDCASVLDQYGSLARIAPNKVVTNDPFIWAHMSAPRSRFTKGTWYDPTTLDPNQRNSLSQRDDKLHSVLRAKMTRGYSGKDIPALESNIDDRINDMVVLIRNESGAGKPVDMAKIAQFFTLDVLTQIAFEAPFGYLTKNQDVFQYIQKVQEFLHILELASNIPTIHRMLSSRIMLRLFGPKPTDKLGMGAMLGVARRVVNERYAPDAKVKDDMLGSFKRHGLSRDEAENEAVLQLLGGSDSTATAIRMTFLFILTNPAVYAKLTSELSAHKGQISSPVIQSAEARELPYLQSCIKEGLRVFPPLAGLQGKVSPLGGETVNGYFIPGNIEVGWNPMSMQRRHEIYGEDAEMFRPDRWIEAAALDDDGAKLGLMEKTLGLVFGHGKYGCLGKTIALMELDKIFVALFQNFDFALVDVVRPVRTFCHGAHLQSDMWVRATERNVSYEAHSLDIRRDSSTTHAPNQVGYMRSSTTV
ncbi:hypothetical protein LTS03_011382 [Exophiala xenobiotica]|nr:hypothetical protein LTR40_003636 [Exophiala xenobiotica]KAK5285245.1 hypothetical protein LTR14_011113 [Exophiala xenobiotica]KAK5357458.1 hypothetical protein LTR11_011392 [Exophiala xenobiotica]KAK5358046.1 hypothetical protein LTS03_011382 [Exophiala xenobiotica]